MKKLTKALSIALATSLMTVPVFASTISLRVNNTVVTSTVAPFEQNGTTLVPLRIVSEKLGANVEWNQKTKVITIKQNTTTIVLTVGSKTAKVNGVAKELLLAPQIKNNTTMVPIRFVSENLNCTVNWDKANQTVSVNSKDVAYEESKGEKVTTFQNPKVIDGTVYLTKSQLEDAFGVTVEDINVHTATITRKDFHAWLIGKDYAESKNLKIGDAVNRIKWAYLPYEGANTLWIKDGGAVYFPANYLAPYLNSEVNYNPSTKEVTITNNGIEYIDTVDGQYNTIKGYAYLSDGSPAVGARVALLESVDIVDIQEAIKTDKNGYYEFKDVDTLKYPTIRVVSSMTVNGTEYSAISPQEYLIDGATKLGYYSNINQMPDMYITNIR